MSYILVYKVSKWERSQVAEVISKAPFDRPQIISYQ